MPCLTGPYSMFNLFQIFRMPEHISTFLKRIQILCASLITLLKTASGGQQTTQLSLRKLQRNKIKPYQCPPTTGGFWKLLNTQKPQAKPSVLGGSRYMKHLHHIPHRPNTTGGACSRLVTERVTCQVGWSLLAGLGKTAGPFDRYRMAYRYTWVLKAKLGSIWFYDIYRVVTFSGLIHVWRVHRSCIMC